MFFLAQTTSVSVDTNITTIMLAMITLVGTIATATLAYLTARNGQATQKNAAAITEVHQVVNSRMGELIETTKALAKAAGVKEGQSGVAQADTLPLQNPVTDTIKTLNPPVPVPEPVAPVAAPVVAAPVMISAEPGPGPVPVVAVAVSTGPEPVKPITSSVVS